MISIKTKFRASAVQNKEGTIYFQLIQNSVSKQIKTSYKIFPGEWDADHSILNISKAAYHRRTYLEEIETNIIRDIAFLQRTASETNDIHVTVNSYANIIYYNSLQVFGRKVSDQLFNEGRIKTSQSYKTSVRSFNDFTEGKNIAFSDLKPALIKQYEQYLKSNGICNNSVSFYMRTLRAIYNRAVEAGVTKQQYPFKWVYVGTDKTLKRAVEVNVISRLKALNLSDTPNLELARDLFMFSFYARGMAFVDVAHLSKTNIRGNYLVYQRHKTGQELSVKIEPCMQLLMDRYKDNARNNSRLFPVISDGCSYYESALRVQNQRLKKISERMNLDFPLTSYVARHSWATLAKRKGVAIQVISEGMGHNNEKTTRIYLSSLDKNVIDKANAKILKEI